MKNIFPNLEERQTLLTQLNLLGAKHVYVEFRGGGDEGEIEGVYYRDKNDEIQDIPTDMIAWTTQTYGEQPKVTKDTSLVDVLEDLCYRALDQTGLDWYNNDGGQGNLHIDFTETPTAISLNVGVNTMSTDDYHFDMNEEDTE